MHATKPTYRRMFDYDDLANAVMKLVKEEIFARQTGEALRLQEALDLAEVVQSTEQELEAVEYIAYTAKFLLGALEESGFPKNEKILEILVMSEEAMPLLEARIKEEYKHHAPISLPDERKTSPDYVNLISQIAREGRRVANKIQNNEQERFMIENKYAGIQDGLKRASIFSKYVPSMEIGCVEIVLMAINETLLQLKEANSDTIKHDWLDAANQQLSDWLEELRVRRAQRWREVQHLH